MKNKTVLAFETTSPFLSVALGAEGKLKEIHSPSPLRHSENLIPWVDRLLKSQKLSMDQIDALAIDQGPGSFTGLRIGFSFLKGLQAVRKIPCYGALSLDMITANVAPSRKLSIPEKSELGVVMDARRDAVYARFYSYQHGDWAPQEGLKLFSLDQLTSLVREKTFLVGDALDRYKTSFEKLFTASRFLSSQYWHPSAATLVKWFFAGDARLTPLKKSDDFLPLYFRASEAEEKRRSMTTLHGA